MRRTARCIVASLCAVALSGCTGGGLKQVAPAASSHPLGKAQLELRVLHHVGRIFYCDPDLYPVSYGTRAQAADRGFPRVRRDAEAFQAILTDLRIAPTSLYTLPTKERVWGLYKRMNALGLQHTKDGYKFDITPSPTGGTPADPKLRHGFVSDRGAVYLGPARDNPNFYGCPICLVRSTFISTPAGPVTVDRLRVGDPVWTASADGDRIASAVRAVGRVPVGPTHAVVAVRLDDGRQLVASPGHPLADGRRLIDLSRGSEYDGSRVASITWENYTGGWTYDLLPAGTTGEYWADGVLVDSTLAHAAA